MVGSRFQEKPDHFPKEMLLELAAVQSKALPEKSAKTRNDRRDLVAFKVEEDDE